ncbi:hypothetical protein B0T21DRAFT_338119 [Apiosordaria backusii]|uniref:DUF676 domain-containing protein n=1 Tax=Apiosordaria backusii TaxID=314023 RepID=A0AA40ASV3_9PEZI|nr:hypothetical protein B0T21DRAFT_338119 [Apiosordaria backusii]
MEQGTINLPPSRYEFTTVYSHPLAKADIVLVHGLNGDPLKTWTSRENGVYWPTDLLPAALKDQHANILVYGYNADVYSSRKDRGRSPSDNFVHQHAQSLIASLTHHRKADNTERNPIIWVAHSLGGILVKRALLYSNDVRAHHQEDFRSVFVSTYGIIFLGTPHNGSDVAIWGRVLQYMSDVAIPRKLFETQSVLLKALKKDNETLQEINGHFLDVYQRFRIQMVHECHTSDVRGSKILVVDAASAGPQLPGVTYYGIEKDHSGMCKFEGENAPGWRNVSTTIRQWVADGVNLIPPRWVLEEKDRQLRASLENFERARPYVISLRHQPRPSLVESITSMSSSPALMIESVHSLHNPEPTSTAQTPTQAHPIPQPLPLQQLPPTTQKDEEEPLFLHPEPFRPNSFFIGRQDELRGLHEMLQDRKRRSEGTSAVLISCLPGGGKTHLARQYVFQHLQDYPGGVFWIRAKSRQEIEQMFWRIAKTNSLLPSSSSANVTTSKTTTKDIVCAVKSWLLHRSNWLLVFDGLQFDMAGLTDFIPDARNSSLIYTSTERAVASEPKWDNPQVIKLGLLTPVQAQQLLLLELERKPPFSPEELAVSLELVNLMGRLPLMIHVAAQHLKATREPLGRYLASYKSGRNGVGGLSELHAYKAVVRQLETRGENASLNLISLLSFWDQHVPVEMLGLGIGMGALGDKVTPVKTRDRVRGGSPSLGNTMRVLIAFGLVERNEVSGEYYTESSGGSTGGRSSSRQSGYGNGNGNHTEPSLDILRIHSVVQAFFMESLHQKREAHFWLERSTAIWCRSYDEADRRITCGRKIGRLPDDYRRYCIHGEKLLKNVKRFEKSRRYPKPNGLDKARAQLEERLARIRWQIEQVNVQGGQHVSGDEDDEEPVSVFDRVRYGSGTESQSDGTIQSGESQNSWGAELQSPGVEEMNPMEFPVTQLQEEEDEDQGAPYPSLALMPDMPEMPTLRDPASSDEDDRATVVPPFPTVTPSATTTVDAAGFLTPTNNPSYENLLRPSSWRDKTVLANARVALTNEVALASLLTRRGPSQSRFPIPRSEHLTARSDAEQSLNKIKLSTSPPPSVIPPPDPVPSRPKTLPLLGRNSYSLPQTQQTPAPESEALGSDFSTGLSKMLSDSKTWTAATVKKLLSPSSTPRSSLSKSAPPQQENITVPPAPIFRGSGDRGTRSANSSPAHSTSPFRPPAAPVSVRRWETEVDSTNDRMSFSYPTISLPSRQQHPPPPRRSNLSISSSPTPTTSPRQQPTLPAPTPTLTPKNSPPLSTPVPIAGTSSLPPPSTPPRSSRGSGSNSSIPRYRAVRGTARGGSPSPLSTSPPKAAAGVRVGNGQIVSFANTNRSRSSSPATTVKGGRGERGRRSWDSRISLGSVNDVEGGGEEELGLGILDN